MNHKRLLLLGIIIVVGVAWIHPITQTQLVETGENPSLSDTEKVAAPFNSISDLTVADSQNDFKELFIATSIGGSNGVRLNPRALSFVQDYMKDNWDELQSIRIRGQSCFNIIQDVMPEYGLPKELKYLPVSKPNLTSSPHSTASPLR